MTPNIKELIDFRKVDSLLEGFNKSTGFVTAILDLDGNVITQSGWRTICGNFHRVNAQSSIRCTISDTELANKMAEGEKYHFYKCLNGLIDVVVPLIINGEHVANIFSGQFFFEKPDLAYFKKQAQLFGFDEKEYMDALDLVPVVSKEKVELAMDFLKNMTLLISEITLQKIEQSKLNAELKLKEDRLSKIMLAANDGMWEWNLKTNEVYFDSKYYQMSGYEINEFPHYFDEFLKRVHPDDIGLVMDEVGKHIENENYKYKIAFRFKKKSNEWQWIQSNGKVVDWDEEGNPLLFVGTHRDITDFKQVEQTLKESEERFKALHNASFGGIGIHDKGVILECNWGLSNMTGYSYDELIGMDGILLIAPQSRDLVMENILLNYEMPYEAMGLRKNGEEYPLRLEARNIPYKGKMVRTVEFRDITEQKKMDEVLIESEVHFRNLANSGQALIWTSGIDKKCNYFNQPWLDFTGRTLEQELGDGWTEGVHPDDLQRCIAIYTDAFDRREKFSMDYRIRHASGEYCWIKDDGTPRFNSKNEFIGYIGHCLDVSDIKLAEKKVQESEERFKKLSSFTFEGIIIHNKAIAIDVNQSAVNLLGYDRDEIIGMNLLTIIHPDYIDLVKENIPKPVALPYQIVLLRKDGSSFYAEIESRDISYNGEYFRVACIRDITERVKVEEALLESETKFREMAELLPQVVFEADLQGILTYVNKQAYKLSGYSEEDGLIGKSSLSFYLPEDRENALNNIKLSLSGQKQVVGNEYVMCHKDGSTFNVLVYSSPILSNNKTVGLRGIIVDITAIKQTEQELIKAKEKAEESDRLKSAFLANMSHEIRTPMNGILGFADLLDNPNLTGEEQQTYVEIIKKSGARMLNIINDIINISKIEAGLMSVNLQDTNLDDQIDYIYKFFKPEVEAKGMSLLFHTEHLPKKAIVKTDSEKLYAILTNLVKNAIKYSKSGTIEFGYAKKENGFEFFVKDTGIGIPEDRIKAIFERFVQADIADRNAYQGAGLGLSISKAYVEMLGGTIWVESELGIGSCFYFTLPSSDSENSAVDMAENEENKSKYLPKKLKLLIAEDDDISFMYLQSILKSNNYDIKRCITGRETVDYCKLNPDIDLILMDIKMPDINGHEAARLIRTFNTNVIIIAQTAYAISGDREKAIAAGCNSYISKPINKEALIDLIQDFFIN